MLFIFHDSIHRLKKIHLESPLLSGFYVSDINYFSGTVIFELRFFTVMFGYQQTEKFNILGLRITAYEKLEWVIEKKVQKPTKLNS